MGRYKNLNQPTPYYTWCEKCWSWGDNDQFWVTTELVNDVIKQVLHHNKCEESNE